jgi:hypothetical protein
MNLANCCSTVCFVALVSGCAFNRSIVLDAAVGPPRPVVESRSPEGRLVVYSGFDVGGGGVDSDHNLHSDYKIYFLDGKALRDVSNKVSNVIEDPATISLPPGKYIVIAKAASFGMVTVPVVIEAGKTTPVHLDGSELTGGRQTSTNDFIRLPDGLIVGWRAQDAAEQK